MRAVETKKGASALFQDPLGECLAGAEGKNYGPDVDDVILRTKWLDDFIVQAAEKNNMTQLVLVAAGMDSRAFRLKLPEVTVYEVDKPAIFDLKKDLLDGDCHNPSSTVKERVTVPLDLASTNEWVAELEKLEKQPLDKTKKTLFVVEGLVYYLPNGAVDTLMDNIKKVPGADMIGDAVTDTWMKEKTVNLNWLKNKGAPFEFQVPHAFCSGFLENKHGFKQAVVWESPKDRACLQPTPNTCAMAQEGELMNQATWFYFHAQVPQ